MLCKNCGSICMSIEFIQKLVLYYDLGCSTTCSSSLVTSNEASFISIFSEFLSSSQQSQSQIQLENPFGSQVDFGSTSNQIVFNNNNKPQAASQYRQTPLPTQGPSLSFQNHPSNNFFPSQNAIRFYDFPKTVDNFLQ